MSVPCVVCESNIVAGYVVIIEGQHGEDNRHVCAKCVQRVFHAPQTYINFSTTETSERSQKDLKNVRSNKIHQPWEK